MYTVYALIETRPGHTYQGVVRYVGQTKNFESRMRTYRRGRGNNPKHTAWLRANPDFQIRVLKNCATLEDALSSEIIFIALYDTYRTDCGMNMHPGGGYTNEGKQKLDHSQAISLALTGRKFSAEHKERIRLAKTGIKYSEDSCRKRSAALKGRPHSAEHNAKVAEALRKNSQVVDHLRAIAKNKSPEHLEKLRTIASSKRWACDECDVVSNAGGIGTHQKGSGHVGRHLRSSS